MARLLSILFAGCMFLLIWFVNSEASGYMEVNTDQLKVLMQKKKDLLLVYPLSKIEYDELHIVGSVNIPLDQLATKLPADHEAPLVFYCLGEKCTASTQAAEMASTLGYRQLFVYKEGLPAWIAAGNPTRSIAPLPKVETERISTDQLLAALQENDNYVLLDCSLKTDVKKFRVDAPRRIYIPLEELQDNYAKLPKNKKIAVICFKGTRSLTAVRYLFSKGFKQVVSVDGGVEKWLLEKKPVIRNEREVASR